MRHRGFLFSNVTFNGSRPFGPGHLCAAGIEATTAVSNRASESSVGCEALLIGYAIDLDDPTRAVADILREFCGRIDNGLLWEPLIERLNGRFALIWRREGRWSVITDATGMRTVYYRPGAAFHLASHSDLIPGPAGLSTTGRFREFYRFGLPGSDSRREGVFMATPNHVLDPERDTLRRFWPRRVREERMLGDAVESFAARAAAAVEGFARRRPLLVSLTAGLDSRTTLAALSGQEGLQSFTYAINLKGSIDKTAAADIAAGRRLARIARTRHRDFKCAWSRSAPPPPPDYTDVHSLHDDYPREFGRDDFFHVRSNVSEVARRFWRNSLGVQVLAAKDFICCGRTPAEAAAHAQTRMVYHLERLGYDPLRGDQLMGYDTSDLFYWEHRMPSWHGPLLLGSDAAFDTGVVFNSHCLLETMLSVPEAAQASGALHREYILLRNPALIRLPFNPPAPLISRALKAAGVLVGGFRQAISGKPARQADSVARPTPATA